jgi:hypothetical protein
MVSPGEPSDFRVKWKDDSKSWRFEHPWPVAAKRRHLDPGDDKEALEDKWAKQVADLDSPQGRLGLFAFAATVPKILTGRKVMALSEEILELYRKKADSRPQGKDVEPGTAAARPTSTTAGDSKQSSTEKPNANDALTKDKPKDKPKEKPKEKQKDKAARVKPEPVSGFRPRESSSSSSTTSPSDNGAGGDADSGKDRYKLDIIAMIAMVQRYEKAMAEMIASTVRYTNGSRDLLDQTLKVVRANPGANDKDMKAFSRKVVRQADFYASAFIANIADQGKILAGSTYDIDQTLVCNAQERPSWYPDQKLSHTLPSVMPGLATAEPVRSLQAAKYPVGEAFAATPEYTRATLQHLAEGQPDRDDSSKDESTDEESAGSPADRKRKRSESSRLDDEDVALAKKKRHVEPTLEAMQTREDALEKELQRLKKSRMKGGATA